MIKQIKVIRRSNSPVFSFQFMTISKYGNQVPVTNQWDIDWFSWNLCFIPVCCVNGLMTMAAVCRGAVTWSIGMSW